MTLEEAFKRFPELEEAFYQQVFQKTQSNLQDIQRSVEASFRRTEHHILHSLGELLRRDDKIRAYVLDDACVATNRDLRAWVEDKVDNRPVPVAVAWYTDRENKMKCDLMHRRPDEAPGMDFADAELRACAQIVLGKCPTCGANVTECPSGTVCDNGHGGVTPE